MISLMPRIKKVLDSNGGMWYNGIEDSIQFEIDQFIGCIWENTLEVRLLRWQISLRKREERRRHLLEGV
eukprot:CAMPEP_0172307476 /NCGR_PEP_ID=MMETSP1058-20130122/8322_1 /TAXON_ID=83371 /ORGANISM="Detonula confervacea, Strain CCMP 353" /LENGTH=68 /DNA_ID=CAMNT_0013019649 /DNA_START=1257 /DNA_END=1463 /DNA_ORIENTATION=-